MQPNWREACHWVPPNQGAVQGPAGSTSSTAQHSKAEHHRTPQRSRVWHTRPTSNIKHHTPQCSLAHCPAQRSTVLWCHHISAFLLHDIQEESVTTPQCCSVLERRPAAPTSICNGPILILDTHYTLLACTSAPSKGCDVERVAASPATETAQLEVCARHPLHAQSFGSLLCLSLNHT